MSFSQSLLLFVPVLLSQCELYKVDKKVPDTGTAVISQRQSESPMQLGDLESADISGFPPLYLNTVNTPGLVCISYLGGRLYYTQKGNAALMGWHVALM